LWFFLSLERNPKGSHGGASLNNNLWRLTSHRPLGPEVNIGHPGFSPGPNLEERREKDNFISPFLFSCKLDQEVNENVQFYLQSPRLPPERGKSEGRSAHPELGEQEFKAR
jgi:hypothetical protein